MRIYSIAVLLAAFVGLASAAQAQETISVDINKANFAWEWTQGDGGVPDGFRLSCGAASREYSTSVDLTGASLRSSAVKSAVNLPGEYFCVVMAYNQFGVSPPSNEVHFFAGSVPSSPSNLSIVAQ